MELKEFRENFGRKKFEIRVSLRTDAKGNIYNKNFIVKFYNPVGVDLFLSLLTSRYAGHFTYCQRDMREVLILNFVLDLSKTEDGPTQIFEKLDENKRLAMKYDIVKPSLYEKLYEPLKSEFMQRAEGDFVILKRYIYQDDLSLITSSSHPVFAENLKLLRQIKGDRKVEMIPFGYIEEFDLSNEILESVYRHILLEEVPSRYVVGAIVREKHPDLINDIYQLYASLEETKQ